MAGLQRSEVSFRRQGSSGLVWDDKLLKAAEMSKEHEEKVNLAKEAEARRTTVKPISVERSNSNGGDQRGYRTGKVLPAIEPPSPKVSACGFCSAFGSKPANKGHHRAKPGPKRRSR